jgi:NADH:ubiquinone oxidoreductase subunit F (NADH-binding)
MDIISKIDKNQLVGRGGACFPVAAKWKAVKEEEADSKYVICNATEGEPGVAKDGYILKHYSDRVMDGIKMAMDALGADKGYIYTNKSYYKRFNKELRRYFDGYSLNFYIKSKESGYIGGEETSLLNAIEGDRIEPRSKPPFPPSSGLWGKPTLVNNVETFYNVSLVGSGDYNNTRFYTIGGDCKKKGVYELADDMTVEKILKETGNYPLFDFFVQVGGGACGEIWNSRQLRKPVSGAGSITVYKLDKYKPRSLLLKWLDFFLNQSCGKCTPCREGVYRACSIMRAPKPDWKLFFELATTMEQTSFCGLGQTASVPLRTYMKNILADKRISNKGLSSKEEKEIHQCF